MAKLTLSVDDRVVSRAKRYAERNGLSVSAMVEAYLASVAEPSVPAAPHAPILRSLRGSLKHANVASYKKYLEEKYR